jgi:hypothetical protein
MIWLDAVNLAGLNSPAAMPVPFIKHARVNQVFHFLNRGPCGMKENV